MRNFLRNNRGSAVIVIVFITLLGFFAVSLLASDIIKSNLIMSRTQLNSTKAYFAAEVGLERALWGVMKGTYQLPEASQKNVFSNTEIAAISNFLGNGIYGVNYNRNNAIRTFVSTGGYASEHRSTEVSFCIPDCFDKDCGMDDGCGENCPSSCTTDVGCHAAAPSDSVEVEGSTGACCNGEKCYECAEGYVWDGSECVYDCVQQCAGLACGQLDTNCNKPCPGSCVTNPGCVASTDPQPAGTAVSTGSCCDIAGTSYTCYECATGYGWNGSSCVPCVANAGQPYPGSTVCYDAGVYDCFGNQVEAFDQPEKGLSCGGGNGPQIDLGMNANSGNVVYDSSDYGNDGIFQGNNWQYRKIITIDHTKFTTDILDSQFLLYIPKEVGLFYRAQDDGDDILFKDAAGNTIPHEIEYFQGTSALDVNTLGRLVAWLRIPRISSSQDTQIYMYYGNSAAANQQNKAAVWAEYKGVWHLNDNSDSSPSGANITWVGAGTYPNTVDSILPTNQAKYDYPSGNSSYYYGNVYSIYGSAAYDDTTISMWVKIPPYSDFGTNRYAFQLNQSYAWSYEGQGMQIVNGQPIMSSGVKKFPMGSSIADNNWHHLVYVARDVPTGTCTFYLDGVAVKSSSGSACVKINGINNSGYPSLSGSIMGAYSMVTCNTSCYFNSSSAPYAAFLGTMDELHFSFQSISYDYVKFSYENQLNPTSYVKSISNEQNMIDTANWVPGAYGKALDFNGTSNYISFANGSAIPLSGNMTVEAWVYPYEYPSGTNRAYIISKTDGTWGFGLWLNNWLSFYYKTLNTGISSGYTDAYYSSLSVPLKDWSHLAFTYNSTTKAMNFYYNGTLVYTTSLNQPPIFNTGSLELGRRMGTEYFKGKIDEFKVYNYIRTAAQIQYDANENVCNGDGACTALSAPENNTGSFKSCNDICEEDGKYCSSVGTDSRASNNLMYVNVGGYTGYCSAMYADCETIVERNPNEAMPFLCSGYQTNWTNCNCTVCDVNFGAPCTDNPCIVSGTGIKACDGTCEGATNIAAGVSCGNNMECDGLGTCRNVCHPLIGKPCGEDQCNNPGVVDCDGFCIGSTPKGDSLPCTNTANDPLQDQCWGGVCTQCVANLGQDCNNGQCQVPGKIVCDGGCSACTGGDCLVNPHYANEDDWCDSGSGANTGMCNAFGVCNACDDDYLNLGSNCPYVPCEDTVTRDCKTGTCPAGAQLSVNAYCTTLAGNPGACDSDGNCNTCAPGYMSPCNNDEPCKRAGTIMCDGSTCSTSGYLDAGDPCNAGHPESWAYPNTGYCDASHNCNTCVSGYLNQEQCNDGDCQNSGNYLCDGGCDACTNNDCGAHPNNKPNYITTCDAGALTTQPYSGTCLDGACQICDSHYLNAEKCNTAICHEVGDYQCNGTCSTGTNLLDAGENCDAGIYDGFPGRETGKCDGGGSCQTCNWYYIYDQPCKPTTGDSECYDFAKVTSCFGTCPAIYKATGTTCNVDGLTSALAYTGKCDGAGNCVKCNDLYINQTPCNNQICHIPSTYSCEGNCLSNANAYDYSSCNAGYPGTPRYPNTGYCMSGSCNACDIYYINNAPCYPVGVADANKFCYNPGTAHCYNYWPNITVCDDWTYKNGGIPCDGGGNECNGAGVCTTPLENVTVRNEGNYGLSRSCQSVCASSPYVGRGCIDIGLMPPDNNKWASVGMSGPSYEGVGDCSTVIGMQGDTKHVTYCVCANCVANFGQECKAADQCNYQSTYMCNGTCPNNYKDSTNSCDPAGASIYGYCYSGSCLECTQVPNSPCNTGECQNSGTYNCQGVCSTASNPNKAVGTPCSGGGVCNGNGGCVIPSPLYNTPCPIISPKDEECYNPGIYNYDGTTCLNVSTKNANNVCTVNSSGGEGRCSTGGDCVACSPLYNTNCPINSPYVSYCYDAGKYTCDGLSCVGAFYKNQGSGGCGSASYICNSGQCVLGVVGQIYMNAASGQSCSQVCTSHGYYCYGVGYDTLASNNYFYSYSTDKNGNPICNTSTANCSTVMTNTNGPCGGQNSNWTRCNCTNCNANAWTSCTSDPMWAGYNYDSECFNFGVHNCDGVCSGYGVINEGGVCTASSGFEGRCSAGSCNQCASSYLNNELCVTSSCSNQVRQCNGTCTGTLLLGVGESCGTGLECDANGSCIPASSLVDIVVPNYATGQSCNSICAGYTNRHCEDIGTNSTQTGGTNDYVMYYGLSDGNPACVAQSGTCSTIVSRNPGTVGAANYGFTCNGNLTNWTYCRCTNQ